MTKAQDRRDALEEWWDREPWPAIILAVDPGKVAGASILYSRPREGVSMLRTESVDTYGGRQIEELVGHASDIADDEELMLVLALETWGAGGRLGITQWLGLGETRGPWRREFMLQCEEHDSPYLVKSKLCLVQMPRWRSRVIEATGDRSTGKFVRFTPDQWKEEAHKTALEAFPDEWVPPLDAAESACIGYYGARSDEIGKLLPKRYLKRFGLDFSPIEPRLK
jgi:hypothetical protein